MGDTRHTFKQLGVDSESSGGHGRPVIRVKKERNGIHLPEIIGERRSSRQGTRNMLSTWECNSLRVQLRMLEHSFLGEQPRVRYVVVRKYLVNALDSE